MKKITPLPVGHNKKVLIGDELDDSGPVELLCPQCNTNTIVTITDQADNSDKFCKRCSCV